MTCCCSSCFCLLSAAAAAAAVAPTYARLCSFSTGFFYSSVDAAETVPHFFAGATSTMLLHVSADAAAAAAAETDARGKVLSLFLCKEHGMEWWPTVAEGEPEIDVTKVRAHACRW
jgi:hypothetical protein